MDYKVGDYVRIKKDIPFYIDGNCGKIGRIIDLSHSSIAVKCDDDNTYYLPLYTIECKVAGKEESIDKEKELKNFANEKSSQNSLYEEIEKELEKNIDYMIKELGKISFVPNDSKGAPRGKFKAITDGMLETYIKKNHDYGNSFDQSLDKHGLIAAIVRMSDKMNRLESLVEKDAEVEDESIGDTLLDLANYCIMTKMWMDNNKD